MSNGFGARRSGHHVVMMALIVGTCTVSPRATDPFALPKFTLIVVAAVLAAALLVGGGAWRNVDRWQRSYGLALAAFSVAACLATLTAPLRWTAVIGRDGRHSGLALYLSCAVLSWTVARWLDRQIAGCLLRVGVALTASVAFYACLQWAGVEPLRWTGDVGAVVSTMGNPNFAAGLLAMGSSLSLGAAVAEQGRIWKPIAWATVILATFACWATGSAQGPLALAAGWAVVALAVVLRQPPVSRRRGLAAYALLLAGGIAGLVSAAFNLGPLARFLAGGTLETRLWYWEAALSMFRDHPVLGVGLDMFGSFYRAYRPLEPTLALGITNTSDAAHSVPLSMLAQGGLVLAMTYGVLVVMTLWVLVRGFVRHEGDRRVLLGAFGGAWAAYQVQSLVSIDVPTLALWHFLTAGAVMALSLGDIGGDSPRRRRSGRRWRQGSRRPSAGLFAVIAVMAAMWPVTRPLRADWNAGDAMRLAAGGEFPLALSRYDRSIELAPWQASYRVGKADLLFSTERMDEGYHEVAQAAAADPYSLPAVLTAARAADRVGRRADARRLYNRARAIDPKAPELMAESGLFALNSGEPERAAALLAEAVGLLPRQDEWWILLGNAYAKLNRVDEARDAYHRALDLVPEHIRALEGLAALQENLR